MDSLTSRLTHDQLIAKLSEIESEVSQHESESSAKKSVNDLVYGQGATAEVILCRDKVINLSEVRNLVLSLLGDGRCLSWVRIEKRPLIKQCMMLHVSGIDSELWTQHKDGALRSLNRFFGEPITTIAAHPTTTAVQSTGIILKVPTKMKASNKGQSRKRQKASIVPVTYEALVAKTDQLLDYGFPLDILEHLEHRTDYVFTPETAEDERSVVAMDCEMCGTVDGSELTRMSLVGEDGEVLVDVYVKPINPITDYRTLYSGITKDTLQNVTTDLRQAQDLFRKYVGKETYLVGHSLENDLTALRMFHYKIIDTSMIYPHPAGFPKRSSLRFLAKRHLDKIIQEGAHDSIMDARIALELVHMKKSKGLGFGTGSEGPMRLVKLTEKLSSQEQVCCMVDRPDSISKYSTGATHAVPCHTDGEVVQRLKGQLNRNHDFIWAQLQDLYRFYIARNASQRRGSDDDLVSTLKLVAGYIEEICSAAPVNTLILLSTGHGDSSLAIKTQAEKARREACLDVHPWTVEDEERWAYLADRVVRGQLFAKVKGS